MHSHLLSLSHYLLPPSSLAINLSSRIEKLQTFFDSLDCFIFYYILVVCFAEICIDCFRCNCNGVSINLFMANETNLWQISIYLLSLKRIVKYQHN